MTKYNAEQYLKQGQISIDKFEFELGIKILKRGKESICLCLLEYVFVSNCLSLKFASEISPLKMVSVHFWN